VFCSSSSKLYPHKGILKKALPFYSSPLFYSFTAFGFGGCSTHNLSLSGYDPK
jgi:hypothetical protein